MLSSQISSDLLIVKKHFLGKFIIAYIYNAKFPRKCIFVTNGSETWTWNRAQQSRVCAVEMSYLKGGSSGVTRWESETNESVYERM